jgi:hypothetical protein
MRMGTLGHSDGRNINASTVIGTVGGMGIIDMIRGIFSHDEEKVKPIVYDTKLVPDGVYFYFPASGKWKHRIMRRLHVKHGDTVLVQADITAGDEMKNGKPVVKVVTWKGEAVIAKGGNGTWRLIPFTDEEEQAILRKLVNKKTKLHVLQKVINTASGV